MDENPRISDLRKKIEKDPGSRLFAQLAEELRKDGRLEEAIQVSYDGLARHPAYPSARLTLARALLDSGRAEEARPELEQIVKAAPDNILAGRLLGEALEALGESDAAIRQFERALMFSPGDKVMTAHLSALKSRISTPAPVAAPAPPPAVATAPPAFEPPTLAFEEPADTLPSHFTAEPATAGVPFTAEEPAAALPAFGDDAGTAETIAFAQAPEAETIAFAQAPDAEAVAAAAPLEPEGETPATVEQAPEAETIPFALSGAPAEFSDSSASLPAFQFDEPARVAPEPSPAAAPEPVAESAPAPSAPEPEPEPEPAAPPPPAPAPAPAFSLALDRDLASGTISPGAFNMAELQRHFEAIAAAERAAAAGQAVPVSVPVPVPPPPTPPAPAPIVVAPVAPPAPPVPPPVPAVPPAVSVPPPPRVPTAGDTQPPSAAPVELPADDSLTFSTDEFESQSIDTADTMSIVVPEGGFGQPPVPEAYEFEESLPPVEELPLPAVAAVVTPAPPHRVADPDLASQTLPLTSLTLADLYLQQGLKAEAAAVLSQVVRDEPANAQARSKLADVSAAVADAAPEPAEHFASEGAPAEAPVEVVPSRPRTPAEVRAATITALKAFQGAIEREALEQKATEIRTR